MEECTRYSEPGAGPPAGRTCTHLMVYLRCFLLNFTGSCEISKPADTWTEWHCLVSRAVSVPFTADRVH